MTRRQTNRLYILLTTIVLMSGILLFQISTTFEASELEQSADVQEDTSEEEVLVDVENEDICIQEVDNSDEYVELADEEVPLANKKLEVFSSKNILILTSALLAGIVIVFVVHEKHKKSDEEGFIIE